MVTELIPLSRIQQRILVIRGQKVMLDMDIAELYGVLTKRLNEQVKRNHKRFPGDFMFRLTVKEKAEVVANCDHLTKLRFSPNEPFAFTEHGAIMVANILNSKRAIEMSLLVVRVFVKLRQILSTHKELAFKLKELEGKVDRHDEGIRTILEVIKQLMAQPELEPEKPKGRFGFYQPGKER